MVTRSFFILMFLLLGFASSALTSRVQHDGFADFAAAPQSSRLVRPEIVQAGHRPGDAVNILNL